VAAAHGPRPVLAGRCDPRRRAGDRCSAPAATPAPARSSWVERRASGSGRSRCATASTVRASLVASLFAVLLVVVWKFDPYSRRVVADRRRAGERAAVLLPRVTAGRAGRWSRHVRRDGCLRRFAAVRRDAEDIARQRSRRPSAHRSRCRTRRGSTQRRGDPRRAGAADGRLGSVLGTLLLQGYNSRCPRVVRGCSDRIPAPRSPRSAG
jgi:hypothetical protein